MKTRLGLVGAAIVAAAVLPSAADAQWGGPPPPGYYRQIDRRGYDRDMPRDGYGRGYDRRGDYYDGRDPRRGYRGGRARCDRGTGGTIIGAIAGGLLGNSVAGRGDRTVGTVVGAGVGALAGRAVDRDC